MRTMTHIALMLAITALLTVAGCSNPTAGSQGKNPGIPATPTPQPIPVEVEAAGRGDIAQRIETTSNIEADEDVVIYPKISGQIRSILAEEGQRVERDQVLAAIDDDELALRARQAKVARDQAADKLTRVEELHRNQMVSEEAYLDARYSADSADVAWKLANLAVEHAKIRSPLTGIITSRDVSTGDLVQPATPLFRVVDPKSLSISIQLPEKDAQRIRPGMVARVMPESMPGHEFPATIERINPAVDPKTGTVRAKLALDRQAAELISGMFVRVAITLDTRPDVVLAPKRAVIRDNGNRYLFVMNAQGAAEKREPVIGIEDAGFIEIVSGIDEGDAIIVVGQQNLEEGSAVFDLRAAAKQTQTPDDGESGDGKAAVS